MDSLCPSDDKVKELIDNAPWKKMASYSEASTPQSQLPITFVEHGASVTLVTSGRYLGTIVHSVDTLGWQELSVGESFIRLKADVETLKEKLNSDPAKSCVTADVVLEAVCSYSRIGLPLRNDEEAAEYWKDLWNDPGVRIEHPRWEPHIHQLFQTIPRRTLAVTDAGSFVVCPVNTNIVPGDRVVGLFGIEFPMITREKEVERRPEIPNVDVVELVTIANVTGHELQYDYDTERDTWKEGSKLYMIV
jgi:hypothetical protein